jgi:hypothetical protein
VLKLGEGSRPHDPNDQECRNGGPARSRWWSTAALRAFLAASANPDLSRRVGRFARAGLELAACGNTMKSQNVSLKDLLPGFISADKGGVVRLAEL